MRLALALAALLLLTTTLVPMAAAEPDKPKCEVHEDALLWPQDAIPYGPGAVDWVLLRVGITSGIVTC
jgi:hypothetical protein